MAFTIANGATESSAIGIAGSVLTGLVIPAAFTGTSISFLAEQVDGAGFSVVKKDGVTFSYVVAAGDILKFQFPATFVGINNIKIVSNAAEAAARTVQPITVAL